MEIQDVHFIFVMAVREMHKCYTHYGHLIILTMTHGQVLKEPIASSGMSVTSCLILTNTGWPIDTPAV